jgi:carbon-monoxide dehydrogenase medium subunit
MPLTHDFEYFKPASVAETTRLMGRYGTRARVLAGGTDLIGMIGDDLVTPEAVVDIKGLATLRGVKVSGDTLTIGALATFTDLRESAAAARAFPVLREMTTWVASTGIRNRATVVGNICSAVPCCDAGPVLLLYDGAVLVAGPRGRRRVPLAEWFTGPRRTALRRGEWALGVVIRRPKARHAAVFVKLRRYRGEDLAQASVAVMALAGRRWRVTFGAVAPTPVRSVRIETLLEGRPLDDDALREAVALVPATISPLTDLRATREYRTLMTGVMLRRALEAAAARLAGKGPAYGADLCQI